jgi:Uncharacterized protein conserved in bacteria
MELAFLVDVNLPKYFHYFNNENFIYVVDINPTWTDQEIWDYALKSNLVILTKDTDFYSRYILSEHSPKIVYFQVGNQTLKQLHLYFQNNWDNIVNALKQATLVIASQQEIIIVG